MRKRPIYLFLGLLFLLTLGVIGYVLIATPEGHWTVVTAGIQGLATIGLVWVTVQYADQAKRSAEASETSLDFHTAEQRKTALLELHELKTDLRRFARRAENKLDGTLGNPGPNDLYDPEKMQELRGIAVRIGREAGQEAMEAMRQADKVNRRRREYGDDRSPENEQDYRDALESVRDALRSADRAADERLVGFLEEGPHPPVPDIGDTKG